MTAVLYGVEATSTSIKPWNPMEPYGPIEWPREPKPTREQIEQAIAAAQSLSPCAVCGFPNGDEGDSHDRCRAAVERAERRGATWAYARPAGFYWVRLTDAERGLDDWIIARVCDDGSIEICGSDHMVPERHIAEWGERVEREVQR